MGYRLRLGKIAKTEKERFAGKTYEEVCEMMIEDSAPYRPKEHTEIYEIGKDVDYSKHCKSFYDFDIELAAESEFHIIDKDGLKAIVADYHKKIFENYARMATGEEDPMEFLRSRSREWSRNEFNYNPYYLDQEHRDGDIVSSWQYEYAIFNLLFIYRTFDWDKDYLIYSGW